jgi:hypothetical protein
MATSSSIKRAIIVSNPMGHDRTNSESGENEIGTKDETIINNYISSKSYT